MGSTTRAAAEGIENVKKQLAEKSSGPCLPF